MGFQPELQALAEWYPRLVTGCGVGLNRLNIRTGFGLCHLLRFSQVILSSWNRSLLIAKGIMTLYSSLDVRVIGSNIRKAASVVPSQWAGLDKH